MDTNDQTYIACGDCSLPKWLHGFKRTYIMYWTLWYVIHCIVWYAIQGWLHLLSIDFILRKTSTQFCGSRHILHTFMFYIFSPEAHLCSFVWHFNLRFCFLDSDTTVIKTAYFHMASCEDHHLIFLMITIHLISAWRGEGSNKRTSPRMKNPSFSQKFPT